MVLLHDWNGPIFCHKKWKYFLFIFKINILFLYFNFLFIVFFHFFYTNSPALKYRAIEKNTNWLFIFLLLSFCLIKKKQKIKATKSPPAQSDRLTTSTRASKTAGIFVWYFTDSSAVFRIISPQEGVNRSRLSRYSASFVAIAYPQWLIGSSFLYFFCFFCFFCFICFICFMDNCSLISFA